MICEEYSVEERALDLAGSLSVASIYQDYQSPSVVVFAPTVKVSATTHPCTSQRSIGVEDPATWIQYSL